MVTSFNLLALLLPKTIAELNTRRQVMYWVKWCFNIFFLFSYKSQSYSRIHSLLITSIIFVMFCVYYIWLCWTNYLPFYLLTMWTPLHILTFLQSLIFIFILLIWTDAFKFRFRNHTLRLRFVGKWRTITLRLMWSSHLWNTLWREKTTHFPLCKLMKSNLIQINHGSNTFDINYQIIILNLLYIIWTVKLWTKFCYHFLSTGS